MGYEVFPSKRQKKWFGKRRWTGDDIFGFLEEGRRRLLNGDGQLQHDALIVVVCGHGEQGSIIPSDFDPKAGTSGVSINKLHGKVSGFWNEKAAAIPRLFVVDCCRGAQRGGKLAVRSGGTHTADLLYTIYGNSPGIVVREDKDGGFFSQVFTEAMKANVKQGRKLFDLQRKMKSMLKDKSGNDQLTVGDGDAEVQAAVFVPNCKRRRPGGLFSQLLGQKRYKCDHDGCKAIFASKAVLAAHKTKAH